MDLSLIPLLLHFPVVRRRKRRVFAVPGMGYFVLCIDTENNPFAIWETNENAK
jgi:hypothetical protein